MTTFRLNGIGVTYGTSDNPVAVRPATFEALFPNDQAFINYSVIFTEPNAIPEVNIGGQAPTSSTLNGSAINPSTDELIGFIRTSSGTHIILSFYDPATNTDYIFQIGGTPITPFTTVAEFNALDSAIIGAGIAGGAFAPNQNIALSSLYNVAISEGASGPNVITGSNGDDFLQGTPGDDTIITGNSTPNGDMVIGSDGDDTINMSGNDGLNGYMVLNYLDLAGSIAATINGTANTGTIVKDLMGSDTLINVARPLNAGNYEGGLSVLGTSYGDTFNVTLNSDQWMNISGGAGADSYSVNGTGLVRMDFRDALNGIVINLGTGQILDDGFGNIETISGTGNVWEVFGSAANDRFTGSSADESYRYNGGNNTIDGAGGFDRVRYDTSTVSNISADMAAGTVNGTLYYGATFTDTISNIEHLRGSNGNDTMSGGAGNNKLDGRNGNDRLIGNDGNDTLNGDNGTDTLIGGNGDDFLFGGSSTADLRDIIYGGNGNDKIEGGYGNDELRGDAGNDTVEGGFGADTVIGGDGNDVLTGAAFGDEITGGNGSDFINGGFGYDRLNGGAGADKFYHLGIRDHGSDWIQDYNAAEGDVLQFGGAATTSASDFLIQRASTPNAGTAGVQEVFVTQKSTGHLLWALVDGDAQDEINIQIGTQVFDLLT